MVYTTNTTNIELDVVKNLLNFQADYMTGNSYVRNKDKPGHNIQKMYISFNLLMNMIQLEKENVTDYNMYRNFTEILSCMFISVPKIVFVRN
jgi:hypothetical protein